MAGDRVLQRWASGPGHRMKETDMRRVALAVAIALSALVAPATGRAEPLPPLPPPVAAPAPAPAGPPAAPAAPAPAHSGVAVVAMPGATDQAWPLAQSVYSTPSLRP